MNTLDFLRWVLPTKGSYVSFTIDASGKVYQTYYNTVEELAKQSIHSDKVLKHNVYYAISSFEYAEGVRKNRTKNSVLVTKFVAFDVDCGPEKPFADWKKGLKALSVLIATLDLPQPMVVRSGNGLHVYWVLKEELEPDRWERLAYALKEAGKANGFDCDAGLTGNSSLVLRPTETHNLRGGRKVEVIISAPLTDEQTMLNKLAQYVSVNTVAPPQTTQALSPLAQSMAVLVDFPPSVSKVLENKCLQIAWAINNPKKVPEPMWYSLMGVAAFCELPETTAKEWSQGHPDYNEATTLKKLKQWRDNTTGPATCKKFQDDRPSGCDKCRFKNKITSPNVLGVQHETVEIYAGAPDEEAARLPPPGPYHQTPVGIKAIVDGTDVSVCPFFLYPVSYGRDEALKYETVRYKWNRQHVGWSDLVMRQAYLADGNREFATCIADQGIVLDNSYETERFQGMLRAYMNELRKTKTMTNLYATMGWKENFTQFVMGDTLHRRKEDGTVVRENIAMSSGMSRQTSELYRSKGSQEAWSQATKMLETMPWHMFALGVSLSSPLYAFTGLDGITVTLFGKSGGGKTLIQLWQQSVWGNPKKLHFASKFTQNTLFSRLGLYNNLPMTIDEVTLMDDKIVGDFLYQVTQGKDKARLDRNSQEVEARTWATSVTVSTNRSFASKITASGLETDAQLARLLEVPVPKHSLFEKDSASGRKIYHFIHANYGWIGPALIDILLEMGEEKVRKMITDDIASFASRYGVAFSGTERYWEVGIILPDIMSRIALAHDLIRYDYTIATRWMLVNIGVLRQNVVDTRRTSFEILDEYMAEIARDVLVIFHTEGEKPAMDHSRPPRDTIKARFDVYRKGPMDKFQKGTMMLVLPPLKVWIASSGIDYNTFKKEFVAEGIDATPTIGKFTVSRNSPLKLGQQYVLGLNLNHPKLKNYLDDADLAAEEMTLGDMKVVSQTPSIRP